MSLTDGTHACRSLEVSRGVAFGLQLEGSQGLDGCVGFIVSKHLASPIEDRSVESVGRANQEDKVSSKPFAMGEQVWAGPQVWDYAL